MTAAVKILVAVLAIALVVVAVQSAIVGRKIGAAAARIQSLQTTITGLETVISDVSKRETAWRDSAAKAHNAGARSEAAFKERVRTLRPVEPAPVTQDTAAARAIAERDTAISERDSALVAAEQTIRDKNAELAARDSADRQHALADKAREERYAALKKINGEMEKLIPSKTSRVVTAAKWIAVGYAIGSVVK